VQVPPGSAVTGDESEGGTFKRAFGLKRQVHPEDGARRRVAQLDLGRPNARRREANDVVSPPVVSDGVSYQHVPQCASPQETSTSASASGESASIHQKYGVVAGRRFTARSQEGRKGRLVFIKLGEDVADKAVVVARPRPKFFPVRDPEWRHDVFIRVGIPVLGATVAAMGAWLIAARF